MVEMAMKGDRFKCDLGVGDMPLQNELKEYCKGINFPITFMCKPTRENIASGEITHEDICASAFGFIATNLERSASQFASIFKFKNFYLAGSLMKDNPYIESQLGKYVASFQTFPKVYYLDNASHLGIIGALLSTWD